MFQYVIECYSLQVSAIDKDTVETSGEITYTIYEAASGPSTNIPFSLNRNTGELKTNKEIKYVYTGSRGDMLEMSIKKRLTS